MKEYCAEKTEQQFSLYSVQGDLLRGGRIPVFYSDFYSLNIMFAYTRFCDQFVIADIAAHAFLEIDLGAANCAGGTGLLTHLANIALRHTLDAPRGHQRYHAESRT